MYLIDFTKIADKRAFEKLTMDLLEAEGFQIFPEASTSGSGVNILAEETIVSHSGFSHTIRWFVQCKHCVEGEPRLTREQVEHALYDFGERSEDGLLIVTNTDVSEEGWFVLEQFIQESGVRGSDTALEGNRARRKHSGILRQTLESRFNEGELKTLCFDLGVDYEGLPGTGKTDKVRELIGYLERRDQMDELLQVGRQSRPDVPWPSIPATKKFPRGFPSEKQLIRIWDHRELENRLLRHPVIVEKYRISAGPLVVPLSPFDGIDLKEKKILIVSDTSSFAYQLFTSLNKVDPNVQMITVWQYNDPLRCELILKDILGISHDLIIFFLGDTFSFPIPQQLLEKLVETAWAGKGVILFPFFAWALHQGLYQILNKLVPVELATEPSLAQLWLKASRILSGGDLSWLNPEAFIENQPVAFKVDEGHAILKGINENLSIIHSFEFLALKEGAQCILADNLGTPFVTLNKAWDAPVVYVNSCTHNCLTTTPMLSPFEASEPFQRLIVNIVLWCLGLEL